MDEYSAVIDMSLSASLRKRIAGCIAVERIAPQEQPEALVGVHMSRLCGAAGWAQKWLSAKESGLADPGAEAAVITPGDILARVQSYFAGDAAA